MSDVPAAVQPKASLPNVVLGARKVPFNVLRLVPLEAAVRYQVCAFEMSDDIVKLAIVHPEQLKQGFDAAVRDIAGKLGKKVLLYRTDPGSFAKVLRQYREESRAGSNLPPLPAEVPKPPLFELGRTVVHNVLRRVPLDYVVRRRLMCVDFLAPDTYWFVSDDNDVAGLRRQLSLIEKHNRIKAYLIRVGRDDFEELRQYYESLEKKASMKDEGTMAKVDEGKEPEKEPETAVPTLASDVVTAESQATIVSSGEEKGGLAGLFQKVGSGMLSSQKNDSEAADLPEDVPKPGAVGPLPPTVGPAVPVPVKEEDPKKGDKEGKESEPEKKEAPITPSPVPATAAAAAAKAAEDKPDEDGNIGKLLDKQVESVEELKEIVRKGFIPRVVAAIVSFGIHQKASDIHIEAYEDEVRVRFRIDGQLLDVVKVSPEVHASVVSRIKILSRLRLDESRVPQDGRFDVRIGEVQVDLRVSVMPTVHGEKVVMRILDKSKGITSLEGLGVGGRGFERLLHAIAQPYGICLMTGPTGSGKSTSLYAILQRVSMPNVNIITLEDPVEYELKGVNQSQIRPKIGFTFAEGLRAVLRQDPNIIMVGEIRDGETATMATQAALTGHLVLSTLHTNDAAGAIPRLTNMGIEPFLIASSLNVVVGQRLVRRLCPDCKAEVDLPPSVAESITADLEKIETINPEDAKRVVHPFKFYQGTGCPKCHGNGYLGRLGIYEVMTASEAIQELTLKHASGSDIQAQAQKEGMITMYQDGLLKAIAGLTSLDEVLRESTNK